MPGLEGVAVAETRLSSVDGQAGRLTVRGYPIEELAGRAGYEEAVWLLWRGELPGPAELARFTRALAARRELPPGLLDLLRAAAGQRLPVMDALRMAAAALDLRTPGEEGGANGNAAGSDGNAVGYPIVARFPAIVAAYWRLLNGDPPVPPDPGLGHAADYLRMLTGAAPSPARARAVETYLVALIDHGMNASTFAARVIVSTGSDLVSAVAGAVGALKGPLHGGAPGPALRMLLDIGAPGNAEPYLRRKLERGERLMGFGHRDYKVRDPRAAVLSQAAEAVCLAEGQLGLLALARQVERDAVRLLAEFKPGRNLHANVEFYASLLMHAAGLPPELFTPTFAVARAAGWVAHGLEQQEHNRLMQPQTAYAGPAERHWAPMEQRHDHTPLSDR
jgi:citrate synthase